jgi:hypothetical protein
MERATTNSINHSCGGAGPELRHHMVRIVHGLAAAPTAAAAATWAAGCGTTKACGRVPLTGREPGMDQHVLGGEPVGWLFAQQAADETFSARAEWLRQRELTLADLGKQTAVLRTMEWIPKQIVIISSNT